MKHRRPWLALTLTSLFLLAALAGCGAQEEPADQPAEPAATQTETDQGETAQDYTIQPGEDNTCTILQGEDVIGGADWLAYPGAQSAEVAAGLGADGTEAGKEALEQVFTALWAQRLGEGAEAPDYLASASTAADLEVSFTTEAGGEDHYLIARDDAFYDVWFQEGALSDGTQGTIVRTLLADLEG